MHRTHLFLVSCMITLFVGLFAETLFAKGLSEGDQALVRGQLDRYLTSGGDYSQDQFADDIISKPRKAGEKISFLASEIAKQAAAIPKERQSQFQISVQRLEIALDRKIAEHNKDARNKKIVYITTGGLVGGTVGGLGGAIYGFRKPTTFCGEDWGRLVMAIDRLMRTGFYGVCGLVGGAAIGAGAGATGACLTHPSVKADTSLSKKTVLDDK